MIDDVRVRVVEAHKEDFMVILEMNGRDWMENPPAARHHDNADALRIASGVAKRLGVSVQDTEYLTQKSRRRWWNWFR